MGAGSRLLLGCAVVSTHPAFAQRTDNNAVTAAEDAFGKSVGDQSIGIYNAYDVRGFSPIDAGNVRIEGLYFDLQANTNSRVIAGSQIRVGISAQGYAFPAPTGIIDYNLAKPGDKLLTSLAVSYGPWRGASAEVDLQLPIKGDTLGIAAGIDLTHEGTPYGSIAKSRTVALVGRIAPRPGIEILPFWSHQRDYDQEAQPVIFTRGQFLPKRAPRNTFLGQPFADYAGRQTNYGVVAKADITGVDVRLGVFRSTYTIEQNAADQLFASLPDGTANRRVLLVQGDSGHSTSGEFRLTRTFREGPRQHSFIGSIRARDRTYFYGSYSRSNTFASRTDLPDYRDPATLTFTAQGAKTRDHVTQTTYSLGYEGKWLGVGELTLGIQKTRYTKRVAEPVPTLSPPDTRDNPVLYSAAGAVYITPQLAAYASYTRGLEESPVAPSNANNFNQAPPALRTQQKDAGLRWKLSKGVTAIAGVFEISKPYFNVDPVTGDFRQLGQVRHRGIEFSLAGQVAKGVNVVIGNTLIDAKVRGAAVTQGLIGAKPVGSFVRHTIASINYRLPRQPRLSFDAFFEGASSRVANDANTLAIPTRGVVHLGTRYRFKVDGKPALLRAQVSNIFNTFGWMVSPSGGFTPNGSRRFTVSLSADI